MENMSPRAVAVQFTLENMVATVRGMDSPSEVVEYITSEWVKFSPLAQLQMFTFSILDLSQAPTDPEDLQ